MVNLVLTCYVTPDKPAVRAIPDPRSPRSSVAKSAQTSCFHNLPYSFPNLPLQRQNHPFVFTHFRTFYFVSSFVAHTSQKHRVRGASGLNVAPGPSARQKRAPLV